MPRSLIPGFDPQGDDINLRSATEKPARPRAAASLILVRFDADEPQVLLGQRPLSMRFMPGKYVFPGGLPRRSDGQVAYRGDVPTAPHCGCTPKALRTLALAAIRETYEEVGLRVSAPGPSTPPKGWRAFCAAGQVPDLSPLRYLGRAITPTLLRMRFDARFFWMDAASVLDQPLVMSDEFIDLRWVALADTAALQLPAVTRYMLNELSQTLVNLNHRPVFLSSRGLYAIEHR
jgi:8-oxo-dGTP pyrophosphatase MutT (NUDIX family)